MGNQENVLHQGGGRVLGQALQVIGHSIKPVLEFKKHLDNILIHRV